MISETAVLLLVCVCVHTRVCARPCLLMCPQPCPQILYWGAGKVSSHNFLLSTGGNLNWLGQEDLQMPEGWC